MGDTEGRRVIAKAAWLRWFMLWVAIILVLGVASIWFDFIAIMGVLLSALAVVLLYQRFIKKRSWRSIMWGVHARGE